MSRIHRLGAAFLGVAVALPAFAQGVAADRLYWDHQVFQNCVGTTDVKVVTWGIGRSKLGPHYRNGQRVQFGIISVEQPANGTMKAKLKDASITLPSNWKSRPYDYVSADTIKIKVTFTATHQFSDGGRIRLVANGNLESVDVPTNVSCTAQASAARVAPRTPDQVKVNRSSMVQPATKPPLSATDDYYYMVDPGMQGPNMLRMDVLLNDTGPHPRRIRIASTTQLRAPMSLVGGDSGAQSQLGTVSISGNGKSLTWTDDRCADAPYICANLPALFFNYTVSDADRTSTGRAWIKFDRPWLLPLEYDPDDFLIPDDQAALLPAGQSLAIVDAHPIVLNNLPGLELQIIGACPASDPPTICVSIIKVITPGSGIAKQLKNGVLHLDKPIPVLGQADLAGGEITFPAEGTVGEGQAICYQHFTNPDFASLRVPMLCAADLPGATDNGNGAAAQSWGVYIGDYTDDPEPPVTDATRDWCLTLAGTHGLIPTLDWKDDCDPYLTDAETDAIWAPGWQPGDPPTP